MVNIREPELITGDFVDEDGDVRHRHDVLDLDELDEQGRPAEHPGWQKQPSAAGIERAMEQAKIMAKYEADLAAYGDRVETAFNRMNGRSSYDDIRRDLAAKGDHEPKEPVFESEPEEPTVDHSELFHAATLAERIAEVERGFGTPAEKRNAVNHLRALDINRKRRKENPYGEE